MEKKTIFALGFFDGVHLGHQALLKACRELAQEMDCRTGVVTFSSHPDALVSGKAPELINSLEDRRRLLEAMGVACIETLPFDEALMHTPWQVFFRRLVEEFQAGGLVCGYDFCFGHRGEGTAHRLAEACREAGIPCRVVPEQKLDGITVSSTYIRSLLAAGEVETAGKFLGHPHILSGRVAEGRHLGRTLGTPTANLPVPPGVALPRYGVYACRAKTAEGEYLAVTNVGVRPTVSGQGPTVEPWLLDYHGDLYGRELTLEFYQYLRPEQKFGSLDELREAIWQDGSKTRSLLAPPAP